MKSNIILTAATAGMLLLSSCDIELVPKGKTTLENTTEIEYLLNTATIRYKPFYDISIIVNEAYGDDYAATVPAKVQRENTLMRAYLAYDETIDRGALAISDDRYTTTYNLINALNVVIAKTNDTSGDDVVKQRIISEARIERAYYHFLIAGIYAAQYDAATASQKGGIAYVTSHSTEDTKVQLPLDKVYELMLDDLKDEYIEQLPEKTNVVRCSKYTGYAIKSRVLFQMKNYTEALKYALKALEGNSTIEDRSYILNTNRWILAADSPNNFWYISPQSVYAAINYEQLTLETIALFEPGDLSKEYAYIGGKVRPGNEAYNLSYGQGDSGVRGCVELATYDVYTNPWGLNVERTMYNAAECYIRTGEIQKGLDLVNKVRKCRIHPDSYQPFTATNEKDAMEQLQRAKFIECIGSYENYFDRKRWNSEDAYKKTITRDIPGAGTFSISPESPIWIQPFPTSVMDNNPTFKQNY